MRPPLDEREFSVYQRAVHGLTEGGHLLPRVKLCYILIMREWMRALMKRRGKRGVNDSESTGKIGQEIPANQPTPLQPAYPERKRPQAAGSRTEPAESEAPVAAEHAVQRASRWWRSRKLRRQPKRESWWWRHSRSHPRCLLRSCQSTGQKDLKGYVVLAIGLPGSGKTTWFKRRGVTPLSSDMLRSILFDDITEQRYQGLVFSTLRSLLRARLIAKMPWNYVDATNLSAHERRQWIKMAKSFGYEAQAVFFDVPLEVCMERNSRRERTVSDEVMRKMAERLRPPSFKEGFSKITMVRVKGAGPAKLDGSSARSEE